LKDSVDGRLGKKDEYRRKRGTVKKRTIKGGGTHLSGRRETVEATKGYRRWTLPYKKGHARWTRGTHENVVEEARRKRVKGQNGPRESTALMKERNPTGPGNGGKKHAYNWKEKAWRKKSKIHTGKKNGKDMKRGKGG